MSGVNEIRAAFLDYFAKNDHEIVASGPLVPHNDPTLMFTAAGMVQFKNVFTGLETRSYKRAVTSQKCVRAGGKHNDLDNVGYTTRHHTFFEMLGNFSFGDYFKDVAIELAWNLITKEYGLPADRLIATVYADDDQAYDLWKRIAGLPESRIIRIGTSDNFWAMGDTGPCGPCSEIFFDHGDHIPGGPPGSPDEDGDRFIEIWNLVFMQFDQQTPGERIELPRPSIDTGMGLERISAVLQGTHDNYETDLFRALIASAEEALGRSSEGDMNTSFRVIADHLRTTSFLIADGVLPSNEGRGYVLRRIMRRAMRHAQLLGAKDPLMWRLVPALVREMGQAFPELGRAESLIVDTLKLEEIRFRKTLVRGLQILDDETIALQEGDTLSGDVAFKLYDTFGFPLDLTEDALRNRGMFVDTNAFNVSMERQRDDARKAWKGSGEAATEEVWFKLREAHGATEFLGYETESAEGVILALVQDGQVVESLGMGDEGVVILNQTPFYGESGGQIGDHGTMQGEETSFSVSDVQKRAGELFVHYGKVDKGVIKVGDPLELKVDGVRRQSTRIHHSATHLLHEALRRVLGPHVVQKGSLVEPHKLRFDFAHPKAIDPDELSKISQVSNSVVAQNDDVVTRQMSVDDAIENGAMALFGEKYGDEVRVVSMGLTDDDEVYSMELCGGTHVQRTGDIGLIKIVSEGAVAAGVRRIEALAGEPARIFLEDQDQRVRSAAALLKSTPQDMISRVDQLVKDRKKLERDLGEAKRQLAIGGGAGGSTADDIRDIGGVRLLAQVINGIPAKELRGLVDEGKSRLGSGIVAIVGVSEEGKAGIVVGVSKDLAGTYDAVDLVRVGAATLGGKGGGGRPDMAQAGGPEGAKAQEAIDMIINQIEESGDE